MDFQVIVDGMATATCVVSVEKRENGDYGKIRIVTGNAAYIKTIEQPWENVRMNVDRFIPDSEYTRYMNRDLNFENSCYTAAVLKKNVHAYAHPARFDVWFDMSFIPLAYEENDLCYCLYMVDVNYQPDAKRMSAISGDIASAVLETCIKLRSTDDLQAAMDTICEDIRSLCGSGSCCVMLMDTHKRRCSVLGEAVIPDSNRIPFREFLTDAFYPIAESWQETIAGSNCLIVRNQHDMALVKERNPVWYDSITKAGGKTIVLFPLEFKGELLGYIWAVNFNPDAADKIKEALELTTFILASEIYSHQLVKRLNLLSSTDMLTKVMNRNEMNNFVDRLVKRKSGKPVGVIFADLNGLKTVNDSGGHRAGDTLLKNAAAALREVFAPNEIFRAGGDEFVVILTAVSEQELTERVEQLREAAAHYPALSFAVGAAYASDTCKVREALHFADEHMYEDKRRYYQLHPERRRDAAETI